MHKGDVGKRDGMESVTKMLRPTQVKAIDPDRPQHKNAGAQSAPSPRINGRARVLAPQWSPKRQLGGRLEAVVAMRKEYKNND
ncbi:MAG: hypothetical protein IJU03_03745 [Thermoguttaceae bacterium]|nr:hypothetical protein [Thermoguttaceae bacterium]